MTVSTIEKMTVAPVSNAVATPDSASVVMDVIRGRRSIGKMRQELPPRDAIETILEAGTWAPCHHVTEPWRFNVIAGDAREALGGVMAKSKVDRMTRQGKATEGEFEAEHRVYRPGEEEGFEVFAEGDGRFRVAGRGIELLVARHDLENEEALDYLEGRLREIGVIAALERAGFEPGDEVAVGDLEFELDPG